MVLIFVIFIITVLQYIAQL